MMENMDLLFDSLTLTPFKSEDASVVDTEHTHQHEQLTLICQLVSTRLQNLKRSKKLKISDIEQLIRWLHHTREGLCQKSDSNITDMQAVESLWSSLSVLVKEIYNFACVGEYSHDKEIGYETKDFEGVVESAVPCLKSVFIILAIMETMDSDSDELKKQFVSEISLNIVLLSLEHVEAQFWTSEESISLSEQVRKKLLKFCNTATYETLLCTNSLLSCIISSKLKSEFSKSKWKQYSAVKPLYTWILFQIKFPNMSDYLEHMLPPAFLLVDDHQQDHTILGVECLRHIIDNVSKSELTWYGRAEVIYDSLEKLMYTHDIDVVNVLQPCLLKILAVLEKDPKRADSCRRDTRYDKIFRRFLNDMELENKLVLRNVYCQYLPQYVEILGITSVKHSKRFFGVVSSYLEIYDGPKEISRKNILQSLKNFILECWPRVPHHCENILKMLIKFMYDIVTDRTLTPVDVKVGLILQAKDCLILVKRTCPEKTITLLKAVPKELGTDVAEHISNVIFAE